MSIHQPSIRLKEKTRESNLASLAPPLVAARGERVFDLHPAIHAMVIGAYGALALILCTAFMAPDMLVPAGIVLIGVVALFLTPALWAQVKTDGGLRKQSWAEFKEEGVDCCTGRLTASQAMAQILVLPALLVSFAAGIVMFTAFL